MKQKKMFLAVLIIAITFIISSCLKERIPLEASSGVYPTYTWENRKIDILKVTSYGGGTFWAIKSNELNGISSPVKHGEAPENAHIYTKGIHISEVDTSLYSKPLVAGETYVVRLYYEGGGKIMGEATFICTEETQKVKIKTPGY